MEKRITPAALDALMKGDMKNAVAAMRPGGIEAQEKAGQDELINRGVFPLEHARCTRKDFEKLGVVYGEPVDDLFVDVTLPAGWKIEASATSSFWSTIYNEKGKEIGAIFYKAAFYDRSAHVHLTR